MKNSYDIPGSAFFREISVMISIINAFPRHFNIFRNKEPNSRLFIDRSKYET